MNKQAEDRKKAGKEPLIRITKRAELSVRGARLLRIGAFLLALAAGAIFILCLGYNPFLIYGVILSGSFRSAMAVQAMVKLMIPLLISALGITLAFKMKFWNIGAEGQIIMGAIFASYFALFHDQLPHPVLILVMLVAGFVGGGLFGLVPAYFKAKFNTNETLFTLMLNYIALNTIVLLRDGPWRDPESPGFPKIARFSANATLDRVFGVQAGWIIGLILVVVIAVYLKYSKQGYEIRVVGESQATARYAGMNVKKIVLRTMFLSGGICGVAGVCQAAGYHACDKRCGRRRIYRDHRCLARASGAAGNPALYVFLRGSGEGKHGRPVNLWAVVQLRFGPAGYHLVFHTRM